MNAQADPGSPLLDAPLRRLEQVCQEFGLGAARVYLDWARFTYDLSRPYYKTQDEEFLANVWGFVVRALETRAPTPATSPAGAGAIP